MAMNFVKTKICIGHLFHPFFFSVKQLETIGEIITPHLD